MATEKEEQVAEIKKVWHGWAKGNEIELPCKSTDALPFYSFLQGQRPELLRFKSPGDPWQVLKTILRDAGVRD